MQILSLRGKRGACEDISAKAAVIPGVIEAEANPAIGSLAIHYESG